MNRVVDINNIVLRLYLLVIYFSTDVCLMIYLRRRVRRDARRKSNAFTNERLPDLRD